MMMMMIKVVVDKLFVVELLESKKSFVVGIGLQ